MPVPMTATTSPLQVIANMFEARTEAGGGDLSWEKQMEEHFLAELARPGVLDQVTSLNTAPNHSLTDGQLVKFRCMVQDMFDPEYYVASYRVRSVKDGSVKLRCGRFRDVVQCGPGEEVVDTDPGGTDLSERQCYYAVSPPGEAAWVADQHRRLAASSSSAGPSGTQHNAMKRARDSGDTAADVDMETAESGQEELNGASSEVVKKQRSVDEVKVDLTPAAVTKSPVTSAGPGANLNLPLPSASGRACIVKLYGGGHGELKLHDLVEFVGVISLDPALAATEPDTEDCMSSSPALPPPSLVPRLHVLSWTRLHHNNPLVPRPPAAVPPVQEVARVELVTLLTTALLGDRLAADYLLLHLVSRVYMRKDVLVLGKLGLNLHNMTPHQEWPRRLATLLSLLTPASHYLPLTRAMLDSAPLAPRKDYEANRLVAGALQLAPGTRLWLDETVMTDGQLSPTGVRNLTSLGNLITWQKLEYDFQFQKMEYDTDVGVLVMSEGRSMLPSDVQLMVKPEGVEARPDLISKTFAEIGAGLSGELLDRLRQYLTTAMIGEFNLTDQVMKAVQDDFVSMRQTDPSFTEADFHALLVLGRLVSLSYGRSTLTPQDWDEAKRMEKDRKGRAGQLPARSGAHMANGMNVSLNQGNQ